jgi:hypothetical protein
VPPLGDEVGMMGGKQRSTVEGGSPLGDGRLDGATAGGESRNRWTCGVAGDLLGIGGEGARCREICAEREENQR